MRRTMLLLVYFLAAGASAQRLEMTDQPVVSPRPGFDPNDVVRHVRQSPATAPMNGLDDGEFLIDTNATCVPALGDQDYAAIAFDGTNFLVVWRDDRRGDYRDIYGARVTPAGAVLDPTGIAISTSARRQGSPAIAFGGDNYLVVWWNSDSGKTCGARVTPAGTVLDSAGFVIPVGQAIAFDGENFLVVGNEDDDIYGARVTPGGVVLDSSGFAISVATGEQGVGAIAFGGTQFFVTWTDYRSGSYDIYGARVTPAGAVLDSAGIAISTTPEYQGFSALASDGQNFLVVWEDFRGGSRICGSRVTPAGVVLDSGGIAISTAMSFKESPSVAFDGEDFLVVWGDDRLGSAIYGARVTSAGGVLDTAGIAISTATGYREAPALAFGGENFLAAWTDERGSSFYDIYGVRVTPAGAVLDSADIPISTAAHGQIDPGVAFDGTNFLAVWQDGRSGSGYDIYGARVTPAGVVLDSAGIAISTAAGAERYPALAFDGENFLAVWQDGLIGLGCDIYGARVTPAGVVLDSAGIAISAAADDQRFPALAFDGGNFLVVWTDDRSGGYNTDIYGARVTPAGVVLDPGGIAISTAAEYQQTPALAFDGQNYLVVWTDQRASSYDDIYGARVTPAGVVLDTSGIAISTATGVQGHLAVVSDGENFLVVWQTDMGADGVYGARMTSAGVVLDPAGITISTLADGNAALVFDGENSLVVWQETRNGSGADLYGARVRSDGTVFGKGAVVSQEGIQSFPALARGPGDQMFLAYQGWAGVVGGKAYGADRIWGKLDASPGVEEAEQPIVYSLRPTATIIRGVLLLPLASGVEREASSVLLDISGRKVLNLQPGVNDVRTLAPGVYFVRDEGQGMDVGRTRKVVIQR